MADCSCYHDEKNFLGKRGVCWGTKEKEPCRCGGDETKCDFYPKRAVIVLSKDKAFEFKLDGETSQIQVIKDMKKYGLAVMSPKTNADRIRAMTDEELGIALCRGGCPPTAWDEHGVLDCPKPNEEVCEEVCGSCWLDWLKQEVKT